MLVVIQINHICGAHTQTFDYGKRAVVFIYFIEQDYRNIFIEAADLFDRRLRGRRSGVVIANQQIPTLFLQEFDERFLALDMLRSAGMAGGVQHTDQAFGF
jgi:hypothetical protein